MALAAILTDRTIYRAVKVNNALDSMLIHCFDPILFYF